MWRVWGTDGRWPEFNGLWSSPIKGALVHNTHERIRNYTVGEVPLPCLCESMFCTSPLSQLPQNATGK